MESRELNNVDRYTAGLRDADKFMYIGYVLALAAKENVTAMMNELKNSNIKADKMLHKEKMKDVIQFCNSINKVFPNASKYLNKEDKEKMFNSIMELTGSLWI